MAGSGGSGGGLTINLNAAGKVDVQSGGGGGGFPAAGIGGGGAGGSTGDTQDSGAGFCNGAGEFVHTPIGGIDGKSLSITQHSAPNLGGAYYESYANCAIPNKYATGGGPNQEYIEKEIDPANNRHLLLAKLGEVMGSGGIGGGFAYHYAGARQTERYSAQGGKGAIIKVSETANVLAYNGSYITTKDSSAMTDNEKQNTQALIYAQAGYDIRSIRDLREVKVVNSRTVPALVSEWSKYSSYRTIKSPYTNGENKDKFTSGIGSGAGGYQEIDGNGTYTIDSSLN